jgi:hypothetical protein
VLDTEKIIQLPEVKAAASEPAAAAFEEKVQAH